jgi:putative hydrolase of the HAD superfamily
VTTVFFDLDDTLLDYSGAQAGCWTEACTAAAGPAGLEAPALVAAVEEVRRWFWSDPVRHRLERTDMLGAWTKIAAGALARCGHSGDGLAARIAVDFADRRRARMALFPEARATLDQLRARGVPLALLTNGDARMQREKIERFDLARYFDVVVIEGEFGAGKPDARVFRHALATLGAAPARTWMIGDNLEWDVAGAVGVGVGAVWIDRAGQGLPAQSPAQPDRIIRSLAELFPLLDGDR